MVFDTSSASENNNMSASDFDASFSDMMSVGASTSYYGDGDGDGGDGGNGGNGGNDSNSGDGYYYYGSGGENDHNDDDDHNSTDDPRYHLFRLMDRYCSVNNNNNNNNSNNNNWEPIRDWLKTMMPKSKKSNDNDHDDLIVSDDEDDEDDDNSMILRAAILEARERSGQTVLHVACERSVPIDIVDILLSIIDKYKYKYNMNASNNSGSIDNNNIDDIDHNEYDLVRCSTIYGFLVSVL
jgi:hypothetical protein